MSEKEKSNLIASIKKNGVQQPLLIGYNNEGVLQVLDGSHRIRAAAEAGLKEVPAIQFRDRRGEFDADGQLSTKTAPPAETDLTPEQQRGMEHRLGKDVTAELAKTPEGIEKAQRLLKGTNQQFADIANEHGPFKPGDVNEVWTADDFKRKKSDNGGDLNPNKAKVIDHLLKNVPSEDFMKATEGWGPDKKIDAKMQGEGPAPKATMETARMSNADLLKKGFTQEDIDAGLHLPKQAGGAAAAPALAETEIPESVSKRMTPEEIAGVTKSERGTKSFLEKMEKIPEVQEYIDIALAGEGARKWYQRSAAAFDAMAKELPEQFSEPADKEKFIGLLAATSPQQSVAMNMREALSVWKGWNDAGRPTGSSLENLLYNEIKSVPGTKVNNARLALEGKDMWPDLSKNSNFKVGSFTDNLKKWLDGVHYNAKGRVTNDSWMALFGGLSDKAISKPTSYHPLSIATRAAAEYLGWEPEEAQAAIWSFTQALTEAGEEHPDAVREYSEDFADLMGHDEQVRDILKDLGVNLEQLDKRLEAIGEKPEITGRTTATTSRSVGKLKERVEEARGRGAIPPSKSAQGSLAFRESPAHESRVKDRDTEFDTDELDKEEPAAVKKMAAVVKDEGNSKTLTAHGAGGASVEELSRNEKFLRISPSGLKEFQGVSPDPSTPLRPNEAVIAVKPDGTWRLQDGSPQIAADHAARSIEAYKPTKRSYRSH